MIRFKLDGTLYNCSNPEEFVEIIDRDKELKLLGLKYDGELIFNGTGYTYLKGLFDSAYCTTVTLVVEIDCNATGTYTTYFTGDIYLADCSFDITKCEASCPFTDNGYYSKIFNNKDTKVQLDLTQTKNGSTLTKCPQTLIQFYDPATAVYDDFPVTGNRLCFDVFDVFTYLVNYMTDNSVTFASTYLSSRAVGEEVAIFKGIELRTADNSETPEVSFQELFKELNKKENLGIGIDFVGSTPRIRIEEASYFYTNNQSVLLNNVLDVKQTIDRTTLYGSVVIGSKKSIRNLSDGSAGSLNQNIMTGFLETDVIVQSNCNTNRKLNLVSDYIIDSNIIEDVLENNDGTSANMVDTYDDNTFFVQYTSGSPNQATQGNYQGGQTTPRLYNELYINNNSGYDLISNLISMIDVERSTVSAFHSAQGDFDIECDTENSDPYGYYNNTTFLFTAPSTSFYKVDFTIKLSNKYMCINEFISVMVRDSVSGRPYRGDTAYANTKYEMTDNLDETVLFNYTNVLLTNGRTYEFVIQNLGTVGVTGWTLDIGTKVEVSGLVYEIDATIDDSERNSLFKFDHPISQTDFDTIKLDLTKRVDFDINTTTFQTYIKRIKRTLQTGKADVELMNAVS